MELIIGFFVIWVAYFIGKGFLADRREAREEQRKREAQAKHEREQHQARQTAVLGSLTALTTQSYSIFEGLPNEIVAADNALNDAEFEFAEGAFAPFWDAIERAANCLARFEAGIQQIRSMADLYRNQQGELQTTPPRFELDFSGLPDIVPVVARMQQIVRPAQKNIDFAQIYEARKTNKLLVQGFSSLGHALNEMGSRIASSIDALSYSMSDSIGDLADSNRKSAQAIVAGIESLNKQMQYNAADQRKHEKKERDMLDNIQRERKPLV